jgi:hypothetical protein
MRTPLTLAICAWLMILGVRSSIRVVELSEVSLKVLFLNAHRASASKNALRSHSTTDASTPLRSDIRHRAVLSIVRRTSRAMNRKPFFTSETRPSSDGKTQAVARRAASLLKSSGAAEKGHHPRPACGFPPFSRQDPLEPRRILEAAFPKARLPSIGGIANFEFRMHTLNSNATQ